MFIKELNNYYEIDQFCKSEGLNTEYFILKASKENKKKMNGLTTTIISMFSK